MVQDLDDDLLDEIEEFLDNYSDVRDSEDGPRPNKAMGLLSRLRESREAR